MRKVYGRKKRFITPSIHIIWSVCLIILCCVAYPVWAAELTAINTTLSAERALVQINVDENVRYSAHLLPVTPDKPARFYLDLYSTEPEPTLDKKIKIADSRLTSVRIGIHGTSTRVVVDLLPGTACSVYSDKNSPSVVISCVAARATSASESSASSSLPQPEAGIHELGNLSSAVPAAIPASEPVMPQLDDGLLFDSLQEDPLNYGGRIWGFAAHDLHNDNNENDRLLHLRSRVQIKDEFTPTESLHLIAKASIEWDVLDTDDSYADCDNDFSVYEGYITASGERWDLSMGRQRVRWGKSDQLSPLDSINPDDLRQFMTVDLEERKLPSSLARLRIYGSSTTLEMIVMPWFEKSEFDYFDSDWALYRNLRQTISANNQLPQFIRNYADSLHVHERKPANSLANMSGALRFAWQTDSSDFALSYRYGWETSPTITSFPVKNIQFSGDPNSEAAKYMHNAILTDEDVEACFKRQKIVGFEWESVFDPVGFRGEIAYLDHVSLLSSSLTSVGKRVVHLVAGVDYTSVSDWYFNVQTSWYRILNFDENILYFKQNNVALLGELRKTLWRGNLEVCSRYNYTISDGCYYIQPAVKLKYFTNLECEIGVMLFGGGGETLFGSYKDADQLYVQSKLTF